MRAANWKLPTLLLALAVTPVSRAEPAPVGIAVLPAVQWSPGDSAREGASEFEVFLRVAQLQRTHRSVGLVSVGDRHGMRLQGGERALTRTALSGVPVVKLAPRGTVTPAPDGLFLDGSTLTAEQAAHVLTRAITIHGAPPAAADPARPTPTELAAIRAHLEPFQIALAATAAKRRGEILALGK